MEEPQNTRPLRLAPSLLISNGEAADCRLQQCCNDAPCPISPSWQPPNCNDCRLSAGLRYFSTFGSRGQRTLEEPCRFVMNVPQRHQPRSGITCAQKASPLLLRVCLAHGAGNGQAHDGDGKGGKGDEAKAAAKANTRARRLSYVTADANGVAQVKERTTHSPC